MLKRVILNRRRADLSRAQFCAHWRDVHGPLLAGLPEYRDYVVRYVQDHVAGATVIGAEFDYDGITELWQKREDALTRGFATTPTYRESVMPDELRFADRSGAIAFFSQEYWRHGQCRGAKLIMLASSAADSHDAFAGALRGWVALLAAKEAIDGASIDLILDETIVSLDGSEPSQRYAVMASLWCAPEMLDEVAAGVAHRLPEALFIDQASIIAAAFDEVEMFDDRRIGATATGGAPI